MLNANQPAEAITNISPLHQMGNGGLGGSEAVGFIGEMSYLLLMSSRVQLDCTDPDNPRIVRYPALNGEVA